ncbi:MAG: hypothetical protein DI570_07575 [Phenylobacterium zucineum]|nr:MAG: hypothetical protein DI570_07575 [Phenylobacterium zucineum]
MATFTDVRFVQLRLGREQVPHMKFEAIRIQNYKGFDDSGLVYLHPNWNVVVGQNNAGKTAFIEGLRLSDNLDKPHKDQRFPADHVWPSQSFFTAKLAVERAWLRTQWLRIGGEFALPVRYVEAQTGGGPENHEAFWDGVVLNLELKFTSQQVLSNYPSHGLFSDVETPICVNFIRSDDQKRVVAVGYSRNSNDSAPDIINRSRSRFIYIFDTKRLSPGRCAHGNATILRPDTINLPEVLHSLMANPDLFEEYKRTVREIFPTIKSITVPPSGQNQLEIRLWPTAESERRIDLSIPLDESGTGVGQVLAILYVAMNAEPSVIGIDEPNSFLHPGAAKALIQVLKRYDKHQYIVSTHSPEIIGVAQPAALHLIRNDGIQSTVQSFSETTVDDLRMMLEEVGASIADVFSVDRVVYVEGPTEKECFDLIVRRDRGGDEVGFAFVALRNTGDFEGRSDTKAVLGIYDALSKGGSILPVNVAFSFDSEGKDEKRIAELKRRCDGKGHVLPRRMTENYLLSAAAIAVVLTGLDGRNVTAEQVEASLRKHAPDHMAAKVTFEYGSEAYFKGVNGGRLLRAVFNDITEARVDYDKVRHGVLILKAVFEVDPNSVDELARYVIDLVQATK